MHTVQLLEEALQVARRLGYEIRHEWLGGSGGGACQFAGRKVIFVDLALNTIEQLELVSAALREDADCHAIELTPPLSRLLGVRKAA